MLGRLCRGSGVGDVGLDSASDTREGQAGQRRIMNYGIIPVVQYVALYTAGSDWFGTRRRRSKQAHSDKREEESGRDLTIWLLYLCLDPFFSLPYLAAHKRVLLILCICFTQSGL